ncbi:MAG: site-specific integrase [Pseudomonadota bacterium]
MASVRKHKDRWRAFIDRKGVRKSRIFDTKREASDWAAREEYKILHADRVAEAMPVGDLFDRYAREVSPAKRGHRWEVIRLEKLGRDKLAKVRLADLSEEDVAEWRDRRLREVAPGSVRREMALISAVFTVARREWRVLDRNPVADVRKPTAPAPRTRLPTDDDFERLAHVAGEDLSTGIGRAYHAFRFACATAMRAGEIVGLTWANVDLETRVAHLPKTKNGRARDVPMTSEAVALLEALPRNDPVFGLSSRQLDALWRKVRDKAAVEGLNFHDSRAYATTQLAAKVDVLTLAKITGHRDIRLLSEVYYREGAADIARRLD